MIAEFSKFKKYTVDIIVHSNIEIELPTNIKVNIIKLNDYEFLPLTTRATFIKYKNEYIYIYILKMTIYF